MTEKLRVTAPRRRVAKDRGIPWFEGFAALLAVVGVTISPD
jgi:hypothetical protein